jgi:hypothetical protein
MTPAGGGIPPAPLTEMPTFFQKVQYENNDKNLMKYLKPVKHLYRVAYADPTEHTKRA